MTTSSHSTDDLCAVLPKIARKDTSSTVLAVGLHTLVFLGNLQAYFYCHKTTFLPNLLP
jgi:hypothetical protein